MNCKKKSWIWKLTWPFAHASYTTILDTIYCPHRGEPPKNIIAHEYVHREQQRSNGFLVFAFAYLFLFPFFWNPFRYKWEREAFRAGGTEKRTAHKMLRSRDYGWLILHKMRGE